MKLDAGDIRLVAGSRARASIVEGLAKALPVEAPKYGLNLPHRLCHFLAQTAHESARFNTTTEYASGKAYEGRKDLGNAYAGDGMRFKGRGLIQTTGRYNYRKFTAWIRGTVPNAPDFEANPELVAEFPWAMLSAVCYWQMNNLNRYADTNNIEMLTRRINGGLNGYSDRIDLYERFALVLLGYDLSISGIGKFQKAADIKVDGIAGPQTRQAMHEALKRAPPLWQSSFVPASPLPPDVAPDPKLKPAVAGDGWLVALIKAILSAFGIKG